MIDRFVSGVWQLFGTKPRSVRTRVRQSSSVIVECLEVRQMLTAPAITAPPTANLSEGGALVFTGGNAIGFTDGAGTENFSLAVQHGQLHLASTTGLTVSGNGGSSILLEGTAAAINSALATLTYTPDSNFSGPDTVGMYVWNVTSGHSTSAAVSMTISPAFTISAPTTIDLHQAPSLSFTGGNAISINAAESGTENVSFVVQSGTLHFGSTTGLTVSGNGSTVVTLSGTAAAVNAALATLTYTATSDVSSDYLTMYVQNSVTNHSIGNGISLINVGATVPPTIRVYPVTHVSENGTLALYTGSNWIGIYGGTSDKLVLSVAHGTLSVTASPNVTIQNNNTGTLTLIGSPSDISGALIGLVYTPASNYTGPETLNLAATDQSANLTSNASIAITVTPPITAPTITAPTAITANHGTFAFNGSNLISYFDSGTGTENISFSVQHGVLNFNSLTAATISGNHSHTVLVSGTAEQIYSLLQTLRYTPDNGYSGSDSLGIYASNSSNQSTSARVSITVAPTSLSPTIIAPSTIDLTDDHTPVALSGNNAFVFSDGSGAENFSLVVQHGTLNFGSTTGLTVFGNGSSVVTLSGTAAAISSALATLVYTPINFDSDTLTIYVSNSSTNQSTSSSTSLGPVITPFSGLPPLEFQPLAG